MRSLSSTVSILARRAIGASLLACAALAAPAANAEGTFVSAPNRVDIAYDDARDLLYISNGADILRYQVSTQSFLAPVTLGGHLMGMDISPDGNTLAVADDTLDASNNWIHLVNLDSLRDKTITFPLAFGEGGTYTVAYGKDGKVLVTSEYQGSGWVPLRRYDPATKTTDVIGSVRQNSMLRANTNSRAGASARVVALTEANISSGPFGRYRVKDANLNQGGTTDWFTFEIGVSRDAALYAVPTYGGTFIADANLVKTGTVIGQYAGPQPIAAAFHPKKDLVYFPWAETSEVKVYDTTTWTEVDSFDFENNFDHTGNGAFVQGRAKTSANGGLLFVTVNGGVRFVKTRHHHH